MASAANHRASREHRGRLHLQLEVMNRALAGAGNDAAARQGGEGESVLPLVSSDVMRGPIPWPMGSRWH